MSLTYVARPCPLCGSTDEMTVIAESTIDEDALDAFAFASRKLPEHMHHRLVACPVCTLVYASPVPDAASLAKAYHDAAFDSGVEAHYASRTYADLVRPLLARLPRPLRALDVGTGDGIFLERLLELGVDDVHGVEPSAAPINAAAPHVRERIVHDVFRPERFAPGSLSLITCFQTIEHVPDPLVLCRDAAQLLVEGGALVLVCHDRRSLANRAMGRRSPIYDIEHVQLFDGRSVRTLFERAGLTDVTVRSIRNRYPVSYWTRLAPLPRAVKGRVLAGLERGRIGRAPLSLPVGNLVVIGTRGTNA
jgi:SAM-dependent methyltransferase